MQQSSNLQRNMQYGHSEPSEKPEVLSQKSEASFAK